MADAAGTNDLTEPGLFINRELSALEFNRRVLNQAIDTSNPLLERLRFLCITSSNLDEFFEIRVSGLKQQIAFGAGQMGPDQLSATEQLQHVSETAHRLVEQQYTILNDNLIPALEAEGIRLVRRTDWPPKMASWVRRYFQRELMPLLTPIGLDPSHPFPRVLNKSLNFMVSLEGTDAFGRNSAVAVVQAPRALPRVIQVPRTSAEGEHDFIMLSSILHAHVEELFPGMEVHGCYQFRVTRNSDLFVDDEEIDDLVRALEGELLSRRFGEAVRVEVADNCPDEMISFLKHEFHLDDADVFQCNGPVNLTRLSAVCDLVERPDLKFRGFRPGRPRRLPVSQNLFDTIRRGDLLLHHPFQSFAPVIEFLRQAAEDPSVISIRQTLYRTGNDSAVVEALIGAARAGKEVTVVVEVKARFDEEENIDLANRLQEAGAHVVYGVVGHKTHAKMILVVRREGKLLKRYVHLGTGNYHPKTARLYTDYGLFTCDTAIGLDVQKLFHQITAPGRAGKLKKLYQSPFTLHKAVLDMIQRETALAREGKTARIIAKMNALVEVQVIQALYEASQAGVRIDLVVRGVCSLRPGVPGVSENIQVRSIVGRFLEHTRVFYFHADGEEQILLSSADWMGRNFFNRIETAFPIEDKRLKARIKREILTNYLADNTRAWVLQSNGSYEQATPGGRKRRDAQARLLEDLADA